MLRLYFLAPFFLTPILLFGALLSAQDDGMTFEEEAAKVCELVENGKIGEAKRIVELLLRRANDATDAGALSDIGIAFENTGCLREAEPLHAKVLEIRERQLGKDHPETLQSLNDLAILYKNQGRYAEAEPLYKRALEILNDPDDFDTAVLLNNLAMLCQDQGRDVEAESFYREALEIHEKTLKDDDPDLSPPLHNLARLYRNQGRYDEAAPLQKRALEIDEKQLGRDHPDTAISLCGLAALFYEQKRYADAEPLYNRALEIYENRLGKDHPRTADCLNDLAALYEKQGRYDDAEPLINRAIFVFNKKAVAANIGQIWYGTRSQLYKVTARPQEAVSDLKRAMDLSLEVRKHASGSDEQRSQTFARYYHLFETMVDWQYELGDMNEAYEAMERSRAQGLQDLVNSAGIDLLAGLPEETVRKLRDDESMALAEIASYEKRLEVLHVRTDMNDAQKNAEESKWTEALKEARRKLVDAMAAIRSASPAYRLMIAEDRKPVAIDTVRQELVSEKTLALEYLVGGEKSYVLIYGLETEPRLLPLALDEKQAEYFEVEAGALSAKKLEAILQNENNNGVLQLVGNSQNIETSNALDPKTHEKLAILWALLIPDENLRTRLLDGKSFQRLLILPDGALARLPFEMLVVEQDAVNPQFLLDRGPATVYAPSASMYYNLKHRKTKPNVTKTLTVGNPDYTIRRSASSNGTLSEIRNTRRASRIGALQPLPWTEKETQWIMESCRKNDISVVRLDQDQSTEKNVRNNVTGRRTVHLACHGLAEDDTGNALFSMLALTTGDPNDPKNDGFLELAEMFDLDLKSCELAVLSACDTNLGPNQHGEGTWSMGRGMLASGAKRVVTTDWQVADDASAHLVYHFLDQVNGSPTPDHAAALRDAKHSIRNDKERPHWRHPYYWAPFVLIGTN